MSGAVRYEVRGGRATLTLDQVDTRNALSPAVLDGLGDGLAAAIARDNVRVIVLTNEGGTFCAGADLRQANPAAPSRYSLPKVLGELIQDAPKPVVARIAGHCMGGGVGLAAACDISIAADDVQLGFTEVRLGVAPAMISVVCLPKLRRADATELFLSGERISATRAAEVGLLNRAVPRAELDDAVDGLVEKLLAGGPGALAASKVLLSRVPGMPRGEAFAWTEQLSRELFASDEARAGIAAFREKRPAPWAH